MFGRVTLDDRLSAVAEMLPAQCRCIADIGTDHGFLGAWLLQNGRCEQVQVLDISRDSLNKAESLVRSMGLADRAVFRIGDGADALAFKPDAAVIAGMGGMTIAGILERGKEQLQGVPVVLEPNVAITELRMRCAGAGYRIEDERIVRAAGRHYVLIAVRTGIARYDAADFVIGPVIRSRRPEHYDSYRAFRMRVLFKALTGAKAGNDPEKTARLQAEYDIWKEAI